MVLFSPTRQENIHKKFDRDPRAVVAERKKRKTLQAGWDLCWGSSLAASHSKGGTAAKSSHFEEEVQGWPLNRVPPFPFRLD